MDILYLLRHRHLPQGHLIWQLKKRTVRAKTRWWQGVGAAPYIRQLNPERRERTSQTGVKSKAKKTQSQQEEDEGRWHGKATCELQSGTICSGSCLQIWAVWGQPERARGQQANPSHIPASGRSAGPTGRARRPPSLPSLPPSRR